LFNQYSDFLVENKLTYSDIIIGEFDNDKRIFHLTATEVIHVEPKEQLEELCSAAFGKLGKYVEASRCYMIVDLTKFVIEPKLSNCYAEKNRTIAQNCLFPNGLARYRYQITRMTIRMGHEEKINADPNLFHTKREAFEFIENLIKQHSSTISQ